MRLLLKSRQDWFQFSLAPVGFLNAQYLLRRDPDLLHLHWVNDALLSLNSIDALLRYPKPIVITLHDMWWFTGGCHYSGTCRGYTEGCTSCPKVQTYFRKSVAKHARKKGKALQYTSRIAIVGPSRWICEQASASSLLRGMPILHIPNPIDLKTFSFHANNKAVRKCFQLPEDKFIILCGAASLHDPRKGSDIVVDGIRHLIRHKPELAQKLLLCTFGKQNSTWRLPIERKHVGVVQCEKILNQLYGAADVYVLASRQDNLPNTIAESLASGTPVLGSNVGGISEMVHHQYNGYLMSSLSAESFAEGIAWLYQHAHQLRQAARQQAEKQYNMLHIAEQYNQLYDYMLRGELPSKSLLQ